MSKFLTPPVWYDKNGNLNEMLTGNAMPAKEGFPLTNLSIGQHSVAGDTDGTPSNFGTAVGYGAKASGSSTVLGAESSAKNGIAIGSLVKVTGGIGIGGDVTNGGIGIGGDVTNGGIGIGGDVTNSGINKAGIGIGGNVTGNGIGIGGNVTGNGIGIGGDATGGKIQLGNNNTAYTLNVGNGRGTLGIANFSCDDLTVGVLMKTPLVGFDLSNNFDSGYVDIGSNSDGTPWSYSFSLVTDENKLYKNRIDSIPYLLVRVTLKPGVGLPASLVYPILIPDKDTWVCRNQWNVIEIDENLNSILSMRLFSSLDNVGNPKITIALRSPSGHAINQDYKKVALEVVRVLNTNFTTP